MWFAALLMAGLWFEVLWQSAAREPLGEFPEVAAAALALGAQLGFSAVEAACLCTAWGVQGIAVAWRQMLPRLVVASGLEAFAVAAAVGSLDIPDAVAVVLAGARVHPDAIGSGLARAFATFGALTLARLAASAWLQAGLARVRFARALAVVTTLYLATRLLMWWTYALLQGHSFES